MSIFDKLDNLYTSKDLEGSPPSPWIMHRFLASQPDLALVARELNRTPLIADSEKVYHIWDTIIPPVANSPYFPYIAPSSKDQPEKLVRALMEAENYSRQEAEDALEILSMQGRVGDLADELGVEKYE